MKMVHVGSGSFKPFLNDGQIQILEKKTAHIKTGFPAVIFGS